MKKFFTADIRKMYIKEIVFNQRTIKLIPQSSILIKDALFYENFRGKMISVDFDCCLLNSEEAFYSISREFKKNIENHCDVSCVYVDDEDFQFREELGSKLAKQKIFDYKR